MKVEIYGGPGCAFCQRAVRICEANDIEFKYFDIKQNTLHRTQLDEKIPVAYRSIPQIFVDDQHIANGYEGFAEFVAENG